MITRCSAAGIAAAAMLSFVGSAAAAEFVFETTLSGANEVPANDSPATGFATGVYDDVANTFTFEWSISGLLGSPSSPGSHIHAGFVGENGPIVFGFNNPDGTWPLDGSATWTDLTPEQVDRLFDGGYYLNFHTSAFPGGEVRGNLMLIPSPAAGALAFAAVPLALRRRRG